MIDYRPIEIHIRRARLERSAYLGEVIADGILATWSGMKQLATVVSAKVYELVRTPDTYSTSMPYRF